MAEVSKRSNDLQILLNISLIFNKRKSPMVIERQETKDKKRKIRNVRQETKDRKRKIGNKR